MDRRTVGRFRTGLVTAVLMALLSFSIEVAGEAEVDRLIEVKIDDVSDLRPAWPATDAVFSDVLQEQFASEGAESGDRWPELAKSTQEERERLGYGAAHPILVRTGELRESFVDRTHPDATSEHDRLRWARGSRSEHFPAVHQRGSRDGRIPQRRIIAMNSEDRLRILRPVRNHVFGFDPDAGSGLSDHLGLGFGA